MTDDALVVGFAGRLNRDKGLGWLKEAMEDLVTQVPEAELWVAGGIDGDSGSSTALTEPQQPWCHILGHVDRMPDFYKAIDVFCLPSLREGFPNVNLEAAATSIPVVTTDATGCIDSVADGESGLVVPKRDASALAMALATLLTDPALRRRMGTAGRRRVLAAWRSESVWQRTAELLQQALPSSR